MTRKKYFFTVTAGRSGQNSLTYMLNRHVKGCYAAFEEPVPKVHLGGFLGDLEKRIRRKFFETNELLGRGKVIKAFQEGDKAYIDKIAQKKFELINQRKQDTYFDVSKFFVRGMHTSLLDLCPDFGLILLLRDPISNMRSFLNRGKDFYLDNNDPGADCNIFKIDSEKLEKGELYLWAWVEVSLRFLKIIDDYDVIRHAIIRTDDLNNPDRMESHFNALGLEYDRVKKVAPMNTNLQFNGTITKVEKRDRELFDGFLEKIPAHFVLKLSSSNILQPDV